jgi:hypothetical protein
VYRFAPDVTTLCKTQVMMRAYVDMVDDVHGSRRRVQRSGCKVKGVGFRVQGVGCRA